MFGYVLSFTVCSIVSGAACRELPPVPLPPGGGVVGCAMMAQIEGAKWAVENPNWYVSRVRCSLSNKYAKA